jgi:hypothetical protein
MVVPSRFKEVKSESKLICILTAQTTEVVRYIPIPKCISASHLIHAATTTNAA